MGFFPNRMVGQADAAKMTIDLERLLTMTHGLQCNDFFTMSGLTDMSAGRDRAR